MGYGIVQIYYGEGRGKSTAAIGNAIHAASTGKKVAIIQFLKGKNEVETNYLSKLEPDIKCFNFSKFEKRYADLTEEEKAEEIINLRNAFHYSRKVVTTDVYDLVILDEILGLEDVRAISSEEVEDLIRKKPEDMTIIMTGRVLDARFRALADEIYNIEPEK